MTDIRTILLQTTRDLTACGSPSPRLDAEVLLTHFLKTDRLQLLHASGTEPHGRGSRRVCPVGREAPPGRTGCLHRRGKGVLVASLRGQSARSSSRGRRRNASSKRSWDAAGQEAGDLRIIDIGTGSGAIGIALARELPAARVVATDISRGALEVARRNAVIHGVADRMEFLHGDLFASASGTFDCIVSNPPYIPDEIYPLLPAGIREFEPRQALIAGPDGTAFHREIIRGGAHLLKAGGWIFLEIGEGQKELVEALFREEGIYDTIRFRRDYGGIDRVAAARRKEEE